MFWFGIIVGLVVVTMGTVVILRRKSMSARSPSNPRWHISERTLLVEGLVLIAAGALVIVGRLFL